MLKVLSAFLKCVPWSVNIKVGIYECRINHCIRYLHTVSAEIEVSGWANIYLVNTSIPVRMYEKPPDFGNGPTMSICIISAGILVFELTGDS